MKLFLKGERCHTVKCAVERRGTPPGIHTWSRQRRSSYGMQLREKQRLKRMYGVMEKQFRTYFKRATQKKGNTGANLLLEVERRLDNVLRASGLAQGPAGSRQTIVHGNVYVNGHRCDKPSAQVKAGDVITLTQREKTRKNLAALAEATRSFVSDTPEWLEVDRDKLEIKVLSMPTREQFPFQINELLIVEGMSK